MKQKTVRFYENSPEDMCALKILDNCRKYGFTNAREMVIAVINTYVQGTNTFGMSSKDMDELADKIAQKMKNMNMTNGNEAGLMEGNGSCKNNNDNYQKALSFMDSL